MKTGQLGPASTKGINPFSFVKAPLGAAFAGGQRMNPFPSSENHFAKD